MFHSPLLLMLAQSPAPGVAADPWYHPVEAWLPKLLVSVAAVIVTIVLRKVLVNQVRRADIKSPELRRRWFLHIRNLSFALVLFSLVVIWADEIQNLAISLVAVIVAIVLSTKELIACFTGGFLRVTSRSFGLGDRIEVAGIRGDVIDSTLLSTQLMEIGPGELTHQHTGRLITIPNALFLTATVINETFTDDYVLHVFTVPLAKTDDWHAAERALLDASAEVCRPFIDEADAYMSKLSTKQGLDTPTVQPRVTLVLPNPTTVELVVRVPAPARRKGSTEQAILRRYLEQCSADGDADKPDAGSAAADSP